ncbi:MAG: efflux RND transporter periplasmic adaptor subunit [candidate division NC10 bacterium]
MPPFAVAKCMLSGLALIAAALIPLGCERSPDPAAAPPSETQRQQPRQVRLVPAAEEVVDRRVSATGTLAADEQVVLGTKVAGRIGELLVDLGSRVRRDQTVARIDPTDAQLRVDQAVAALQQARARLGLSPEGTDDRVDPEHTSLVRQARAVLDEARLTRARTERLWKQELIAQAQLDTAVSSLAVAEARSQDAIEEVRTRQAVLLQRRSELELARQQRADTVVTSPIEGAVSERRASVGEYLAAGAPVVTLVKLHPLRLRLAVPERDATAVRVGQPVVVTVEGAAGEHRGRVARISPAISEQNRTLLVEAEVPNEGTALRPGAFAKAHIVLAGDLRVVTVPAAAIVTFAGVEKVLTVDKGRAVEVRVTTGRRLGDRVEIVTGIAAGTPVVGQPGNLTGGQPVAVQP